MTQYMIPVDNTFVEEVAKLLARKRVEEMANLTTLSQLSNAESDRILVSFNNSFENMWASYEPEDEQIREECMEDVKAVISIINLKLLTH